MKPNQNWIKVGNQKEADDFMAALKETAIKFGGVEQPAEPFGEWTPEEKESFDREWVALEAVGNKLGVKHAVWSNPDCDSTGFDTVFPLTAKKERTLWHSMYTRCCEDHVIEEYKRTHKGFDPEKNMMWFSIQIPQGSTWGQVWKLTDELVEISTDGTHVFVEAFDLQKNGSINVFMGS